MNCPRHCILINLHFECCVSTFLSISKQGVLQLCLPCSCSYLYWADTGLHAKIERSRLDGSERVTLVENSNGETQRIIAPTGLALDYEENVLYWCDRRNNIMERINLNSATFSANKLNITPTDCMSLTVWNKHIFWIDV